MAKITKTRGDRLVNQLKSAVVEKDVETAYKAIFQERYDTTFPSPYGSDGYIEPEQASLLNDNLRLLLEVKYDHDLKQASGRAKIVAQCIYYLKKFQDDAQPLPNVIVGGDENEIFTLYAPKIYKYLDNDYDWLLPPSSAWKLNESLYKELINDSNLNVFVFDIRSSAFDIRELFNAIDALAQQNGDFKKLKVTEATIRKTFDEFVRFVFGGKWVNDVKKIGAQQAVAIFIQSILGNKDTYLVPTKKNKLRLASGEEITINSGNYDAFFSRYDRNYAPSEIDTITAVADQLIEEVMRRFHGDFWTPTIWAERAIEMINTDLGPDWREKYVVWDPAAGAKNLTRDWKFKELYSSTIHQSEIEMSTQYNREASVFQYDFLNDDIDINPDTDPRELKMPRQLFEALKNNKPIVFYTNPPYGQAGTKMGEHKKGIADTKVGAIMNQHNFGLASVELYTQFMYRVMMLKQKFNLTNVHILFFSNKGFLTSPSFSKFSENFLQEFSFDGGFMFNSGEFSGTSARWGIVFSHFKSWIGNRRKQLAFTYQVEESAIDGVHAIESHTLRSETDIEPLGAWAKTKEKTSLKFENGKHPKLVSAFEFAAQPSKSPVFPVDTIGSLMFDGDAVQGTTTSVFLTSYPSQKGHNRAIPVTKENFERACVAFAVRRSILPDASWVNDKDIFRRPSDEFQSLTSWDEFVHDCIVYALFNKSSYQTSLRGYHFDSQVYDVFNEWFYIDKKAIMELAEKHELNDIYYDARSADERFVYKYLKNINLSSEATAALKQGNQLTKNTFSKRFIANEEHPEWQLMTWDAGFYQAYKITTMFKSEYAKQLTEFKDVFLQLEAKIRKQVYADGMLNK